MDDDEKAPHAPDRPADTRLSPAEVAAFLGQKDANRQLRRVAVVFCAPKTPWNVVDDVWQDANVAALTSKWRPRSPEARMPWAKTIVRRAAANYFRREAVHRKWLHPDADVAELASPADDGSPGPPLDAGVDGWLLGDWLEERVCRSVRDAETLEMIRYKAEAEKSWEEVAAEWETTVSAVHNRVHKLKKKYLARYEKHRAERNRMLIGVSIAAAVAVAVAIAVAVYGGRHAKPEAIGPDVFPSAKPVPSASASAPVFNQALPHPEERKPERLKP
jgi:DNA-directed RNA polymerase specialized sigma24 family protein